ncbi:pentatricopeptide repeat-containing protein At4g39530 [Mercurialis annua]|uniref:pentatricopeptide repeat-containing protein At4g39530 n=1 Tax=Mercurialis annua TaxID=3986 RepID=UPI00215F491B|nr:pentatricopeptide repeat-containing protein At4g39530 [Mercurialis annua]
MRNHYLFNFSTLVSPQIHSLNQHFQFPKPTTRIRQLLRSLTQNNSELHYKQIHAQIIVSNLECDTFITNVLLNLYAKSNFLCHARKLFDKMPKRNSVSWSSMVSMYSKSGFSEEALLVFLDFNRCCNDSPNEYILASAIRACVQLDDYGGGHGGIGKQMLGFVVKFGFDQDVYVGTSLVDLYAKSGCVDEARLVFDGLSEKSAVSWTTIITACVRSGRSEVSLQLFNQMRESIVMPDRYVLCSVLSACSQLECVREGKQIHGHVLRKGIDIDVSVVNVLIDFYTKCGHVQTARKVFDRMVDKNEISWTSMIAGYMQNSFDREALKLFVEMNRLGRKPDGFVCTSILSSCGSLQALELGRQVHAYGIKGNGESDRFLQNGLIDMYAKCDSLIDARRVFDSMTDHNAVSYNALIEGYSTCEQLFEVIELFSGMRHRMISPSLLTFVSLLGASSTTSALVLGKQIHALMTKFGILMEIYAGSALIDLYSKCSCLMDARLVFNEITEKDIVVWNAMLAGYTQQLENEEVLKLYSKLQLSEQKPNDFSFTALTTAASNSASLLCGQQIHNHIIKTGIDSNSFVTNSLIDMYAKCGSLQDARKTFSSAMRRDVVCWNSIILTYAHHGEAKKALQIFEEMTKEGINPNYITFIGILSACSHAGLVKDGLHYFESMPDYGIEPGTEHYACVVSLLGLAGKLHKAKEFVEKMPIKAEAVVWRSLLSACRRGASSNVELAKYAAEMAISIDPTDSGSYTLLSNIYAAKGMWVDVKKIRDGMDVAGVVKEAGHSWIEVNNAAHKFIARDTTHCKTELIYSVLDSLIWQTKEAAHTYKL